MSIEQQSNRNYWFALERLEKYPGIPKLIGVIENSIATERLGPTLGELFEKFESFSLKTVIMIALQMLQRLEDIHGEDFIHRGFSPEGMGVGLETDCPLIYLTDFSSSLNKC